MAKRQTVLFSKYQIKIKKYSSVDIDTEEDFAFAEKLWTLKNDADR
jgi:CMP-N-acetylneuraminic acid synthetase